MKRFCLSILLLLLVLFVPTTVSAAAPDGAGPWADSVVSSSQGLRKDGSAVLPARSNPTSALGVAENDTLDGSFFSLGFGGSIVLGFDNGISGGTLVVEATNPGYPNETAQVEVSPDGSVWTVAGSVTTDGEVALPQSVSCAKFVRLTDTSNHVNFADATADAYDVDGVRSTGESCTVVTPTPTVTPTPVCGSGSQCCDVTVSQSNTTTAVTVIGASANTGGNKANKNTGGTVSITTKKAKTTVNVTTTGGHNVANVTGCCGSTSTKNVIKNNGAGSKNTIKIH
ncbi:MAG: hypothetical protein RLZZ455_96 [Candidatus Parcubacteria bacterium]|jgi:hypothetical protein